MDTTWIFPRQSAYLFLRSDRGEWRHELPEELKEEGYTVSPDNSEMKDIHVPLKDRWMYHAVSQVILAHNILLSDSRVDADRIGISGISWGGVISSIVIGHDRRFAFAVPIYGSAFLEKGLAPLMEPFRWPENKEWRAEENYDGLSMPVMWLCWNDDCCFSIQSNSASYLATVKYNENTLLSMRHLMYHSHTHGYRCEESYWFADCVLYKKVIPKVRSGLRGREIWFSCGEPETKIRLFYITQNMTYIQREKYGSVSSFMEQEWRMEEVEPESGWLRLPEEAKGCYLEFTLTNGIVLCSPYYCPKETSN